jgi:hypothetical protein
VNGSQRKKVLVGVVDLSVVADPEVEELLQVDQSDASRNNIDRCSAASIVLTVADENANTVVGFYIGKGSLEEIAGDTVSTAKEWLEHAAAELPGVDQLIAAKQWRLAYNAAYDVCRHAAEAVVTSQGYRITSGQGAHEATLAVANSFVGEDEVFSAQVAGRVRLKRNSLEYLDVGRPSEVDGDEAEWARGVAARAVDVTRSFLASI